MAAAAMAMLAVSAAAWAQDTGQVSGAGVKAKGDPIIKPLNPEPGETIKDRDPTIRARVFDRDRELRKGDIKLRLDGDRVKDFTYRKADNLLVYTPDSNLSLGKHTVKIVAGPRNDRSSKSWSFRIES